MLCQPILLYDFLHYNLANTTIKLPHFFLVISLFMQRDSCYSPRLSGPGSPTCSPGRAAGVTGATGQGGRAGTTGVATGIACTRFFLALRAAPGFLWLVGRASCNNNK